MLNQRHPGSRADLFPCCFGSHAAISVADRAVFAWLVLSLTAVGAVADVLTEDVRITPLRNGSLLVSTNVVLQAAHAGFLVQRDMWDLVHDSAATELHLGFASGQWREDLWGAHVANKDRLPAVDGAQAWARLQSEHFTQTSPTHRWASLLSSLGGLLCASFQRKDILQTTLNCTVPPWRADVSQCFYSAVPRERMCTDLLTPFLKLWPCSQRGVGVFSPKMFDTPYHSLNLHITSSTSVSSGPTTVQEGVSVRFALSAVVPPPSPPASQYSLSSLVRSIHVCPSSSRSTVTVEIPSWLRDVLPYNVSTCDSTPTEGEDSACTLTAGLHRHGVTPPDLSRLCSNSSHIQVRGDDAVHPGGSWLVEYDVSQFAADNLCANGDNENKPMCVPSVGHPLDFSIALGCDLTRPKAVLRRTERDRQPQARFYTTGLGLQGGKLTLEVSNPTEATIQHRWLQLAPSFMSVYESSVQVTSSQHTGGQTSKGVASTTDGRLWTVSVPPLSTTTVTFDFDCAFLPPAAFPPDVSRGFDFSPWPGAHHFQHPPGVMPPGADNEDGAAVVSAARGILIMLPFPDLSMPFNVIAFTSTVIAFFVGSMFNVLARSDQRVMEAMYRRVQQQEADGG